MFVLGCAKENTDLSSNSEQPTFEQSEQNAKLLELYGFEVEPGVLSIVVISNGCTSEKDFSMEISSTGNGDQILVSRKKPDLCKAMPRLTTVKLLNPKLTCKGACSFQPVNPVRKPTEFKVRRN